jgi:hypothetical protein
MERFDCADGEFVHEVHNLHGGGGKSGTLLKRMEPVNKFGTNVVADVRVGD